MSIHPKDTEAIKMKKLFVPNIDPLNTNAQPTNTFLKYNFFGINDFSGVSICNHCSLNYIKL